MVVTVAAVVAAAAPPARLRAVLPERMAAAPPERVFVGLGANLGDPRQAIAEARAAIAALPGTREVAASSLWRSAPVDASGPDFLNAVVELRTALEPRALLEALLAIEREHGRQRPYRNAPRTLDLDLLLHGERRIDEPGLCVPHPRMHLRAFVLDPLAEIAPGLVVPGLGPLAGCRSRIVDQPIERLA
jgi:2-amino-4-hydroxy-6-hydroxymethyldihydropteridine diphosphokinase